MRDEPIFVTGMRDGNLKRDVGLHWCRREAESWLFSWRNVGIIDFFRGKRDVRRAFQCFTHSERFIKPTPVERSRFDGHWSQSRCNGHQRGKLEVVETPVIVVLPF